MKRGFLSLAVAVFVLVSFLVSGIAPRAAADSDRKPSIGDYVLVVDDEDQPRPIDRLEASADGRNRTVSVVAQDSDPEPLWVYVREAWLRSIVPDPAFDDVKFRVRMYNGTEWFGVRIEDPTSETAVGIRDFRPETERARYTFGSLRSISLERPMFVSLSEVPSLRWDRRTVEDRNGTRWQRVPVGVTPLGINLTDANTSGQTVTLSRDWLGSLGLTRPYFQHEDGTPIENASDASHWHLHPRHFSIVYVFTTAESFTKEDEGTYSNVFWDSGNRDVYILSDRRDPVEVDERLSSPAQHTYDMTTSFTVRATWQTTDQGRWQKAVPLFFMGASNPHIHSANSIYVLYTSRDPYLSQLPRYYIRFVDSTGTLRFDHYVDASPNVQLEFSFEYDAVTRRLAMGMYDSMGLTLGTQTYYLPMNVAFAVGKVGTGAWGGSDTDEPKIVARVDDILLDANAARNGGFEVDSNLDGIPDRWQVWQYSIPGGGTRSSTRVSSGSWSFRISESSSTQGYGLQSERMTAGASETYVASVWVYAEGGHFDLYVEFFNAPSGGTRIGVGVKSSSAIGEWEFLDLTMMAPAGTASVDVLLYSSSVNVGTAYFDGADLRRSRSSWAMEVHTNNLPTPSHWIPALEYTADLGMAVVRLDFAWTHVEPDRDQYDWVHIGYWDQVSPMLRARGIDIVAVLSGPIPGWAVTLNALDIEAFWAEWREFAAFIASRYGGDISYYQLLNEENHPWNSLFQHTHEGEVRAFYEAYHGLLDGTGLTPAEHKSRFKTIVNLWADDGGIGDWNTYFRDILNDPWGDESIDVVAIDHYPGTWCCGTNYRDWEALDSLGQIAQDYGKELAVMETGFSTHNDDDHSQAHQELYVQEGLDEALLRRNQHNANYPASSFVLLSWYELVDRCTRCPSYPPQEPNFGILTSTAPWGEKLAYGDLRYQVSRWI